MIFLFNSLETALFAHEMASFLVPRCGFLPLLLEAWRPKGYWGSCLGMHHCGHQAWHFRLSWKCLRSSETHSLSPPQGLPSHSFRPHVSPVLHPPSAGAYHPFLLSRFKLTRRTFGGQPAFAKNKKGLLHNKPIITLNNDDINTQVSLWVSKCGLQLFCLAFPIQDLTHHTWLELLCC